jgi:hypothetical protein
MSFFSICLYLPLKQIILQLLKRVTTSLSYEVWLHYCGEGAVRELVERAEGGWTKVRFVIEVIKVQREVKGFYVVVTALTQVSTS